MRIERIILSVAGLLWLAGIVVWALCGIEGLRHWSIWLWLAGFVVMGLPLLAWLMALIFTRGRD
jgi:uncharacterized membrane protein